MAELTGLVDVHAHFLTTDYVTAAEAAGFHHPDGVPRWPRWDEDGHLALLDRAQIDGAVLSISSPGVHFGDDLQARALARAVNREASSIATRHRDRFGWFASLPLPDVEGSLAEITTATEEGADGFVLLTEVGGRPLADPAFAEVFSALGNRAAVVLLHPTSGRDPSRSVLPIPAVDFPYQTTRTVLELVTSGMLDRHRNIRLIVPHVGAALPALADRAQRFLNRAGVSAPPLVDSLRRLWYDTAGVPLPLSLPALRSAFGEQHVVLGTDYCWTPAEEVPDLVSILTSTAYDGVSSWRDLCAANSRRLLVGSARR